MRDALSIFDLIATFTTGKTVSYQAAIQHLHVLDHAYYFQLTEAFLQCNPASALLLYNEILQAGFDGHHFIVALSEHFRNLVVCQEATSLPLLASTELVKKQYQDQAKRTRLPFLYQALNIINQCNLHYKSSSHQRLHVELALIELAHILDAPLPDPSPASLPKPPVTPRPLSSKEVPKQKIEDSKKAKANPSPSPQSFTSLAYTPKLPQIDQVKKQFSQPTSEPSPPHADKSTYPQPPLAKEAVAKHWQAYAQKIKHEGKMSVYGLLNQEFDLEDSTIVIKLVNVVQQDILADIKRDLLSYLKTHLQRTDIKLKEVMLQIPQNSKPYTAQEKFRYLVQQYPLLSLLQEKLSLEVQD